MILVPLVPFIIILGIGYYYFTTSIQTNTITNMKRIVDDHRQMIDSFLIERKANLEFILYSYSFDELADPRKLYNVFHQLQEVSNAFLDLGVFNEDGIHVNYQGPYRLMGRDYGEEAWFKEVMKEGHYISDVFLGYRRIPHFVIAVQREEKGKKWVIRATIDTYMFNNLVKKVRIGKTGESYILNAEGVFQTERRSGGNLMEKDTDSVNYPALQSGTRYFIQKDKRGDKYCYTTTWLKDKDWLLVVRQERADAFKAFRSAAYLIVLISLIGGGVIIGLAFYMTNRIIMQMKKIDIEKDQLGDQLIRATRLAEIGEMATGIAHEINNPLQIMNSEHGLIEVLLSEIKEKEELKESEELKELEESIEQIKLQIGRCSKITHAVLKFGRQTDSVSTDINLVDFIPEIVGMVENKASVEGIAVKQDVSKDTPFVKGDPGQLQQVLINLLNNAIDAIVERHGSEGGELIIESHLGKDEKVEISVKDNGAGISPNNLKKVFQPFFTTKPVGKGTGLGLSVCYGIIDNMGGLMEVTSQKGVGTTFYIRLPVMSQSLGV